MNLTTFNFSTTVASDGSVSTAKYINATITIENTDEETARDVYITAYNPITGKGGLHDDLDNIDDLVLYIVRAGEQTAIFYQGDYVQDSNGNYGYYYGDLPAGGKVTLTFSVYIDEAVAGTFQDGQSYDCKLFVYQSDANYADTISYTILT